MLLEIRAIEAFNPLVAMYHDNLRVSSVVDYLSSLQAAVRLPMYASGCKAQIIQATLHVLRVASRRVFLNSSNLHIQLHRHHPILYAIEPGKDVHNG